MYYLNHWIPAFAGMTTKEQAQSVSLFNAYAGCRDMSALISDSSLLETSQDDGKHKQRPSVIPAKAGIQWGLILHFRVAGMPTKGMTSLTHHPIEPVSYSPPCPRFPGFQLSLE